MHGDRSLVARAEVRDAPDSTETFQTLSERRVGFRPAGRDKAAKIPASAATSRCRVEVFCCHGRKLGGIAAVLGLGFVKQFGQLCSWSLILNDAIPFRIGVEFRKDARQIAEQLAALAGGKRSNRLLDLLGGAHSQAN